MDTKRTDNNKWRKNTKTKGLNNARQLLTLNLFLFATIHFIYVWAAETTRKERKCLQTCNNKCDKQSTMKQILAEGSNFIIYEIYWASADVCVLVLGDMRFNYLPCCFIFPAISAVYMYKNYVWWHIKLVDESAPVMYHFILWSSCFCAVCFYELLPTCPNHSTSRKQLTLN